MSRKKSYISKEFSERLSIIIDLLGYGDRKQGEFARSIGVSSSFLSDVINLKSGPSFSLILGISKKYPDININWLLNGSGNKYISLIKSDANDKNKDLRLYNMEIAISSLANEVSSLKKSLDSVEPKNIKKTG